MCRSHSSLSAPGFVCAGRARQGFWMIGRADGRWKSGHMVYTVLLPPTIPIPFPSGARTAPCPASGSGQASPGAALPWQARFRRPPGCPCPVGLLGALPFRSEGPAADNFSMSWVQLRSRRDPAFWAPLLLAVLVLLPMAVWVNVWLSGWLSHLRAIASSDPEAARAEALHAIRTLGWTLCAVSSVFSAYLLRYFQLGLREGRLPPPGWWDLGAHRVAVGPTALRLCRLGLSLSVFLLTAAIGFALAVEYLLRAFALEKLAV